MNPDTNVVSSPKGRLANYATILSALIIILAGIFAARVVLAPFFMATFFAVLLLPPLQWLQKKGLSQFTSLTVVIFSVLIVGTMIVTIIGTQLTQFALDLRGYHEKFNTELMNYNIDVGDFIPSLKYQQTPSELLTPGAVNVYTDRGNRPSPMRPHGTQATDYPLSQEKFDGVSLDSPWGVTPPIALLSDPQLEAKIGAQEEIEYSNYPGPSTKEEAVKASSRELFNFVRGLTGALRSIAGSAFIITILVIFMLLEATKLPDKIKVALGDKGRASERIQQVVNDIRNYMVIKTVMSILVSGLVVILLLITKVPYPFLWGFVAFLLNFIPNVGSIAAAIPPVILGTAEQGLMLGVILVIGFGAINCFIGYIVEPQLLGEGLNLSPLVVLISLLFCGWLLGAIGMFLSPPLAVIIKIILQSFPETKWIADIMADRVHKTAEVPDMIESA